MASTARVAGLARLAPPREPALHFVEVPVTERAGIAEADFEKLARTLSKDPRVDPPEVARAAGFGAKGVKVARKLVAFRSSRGQLVLKLPAARIAELVASGVGEPFDPGHGRLMKEWLALTVDDAPLRLRLAREGLENAVARSKAPGAGRAPKAPRPGTAAPRAQKKAAARPPRAPRSQR